MDIPRIIEGCKHCLNTLGYSYMCFGCPYASEDECTKVLSEETIEALKRLQFLEKPTAEEQPELPGIRSHFLHEDRFDILCNDESYTEAIKTMIRYPRR